jgi:hypothetical protein
LKDNWIYQKGNSIAWSPKPDDTEPEYVMVKDIMANNNNEWNENIINLLFFP